MPGAEEELFSIGRVARETGLGIDLLRTWERRYGYPVPIRLASGHRRFRRRDVQRLQLVRTALDRGLRPGAVVALAEDDLRALLEERGRDEEEERVPASWRARARGLDGPGLVRELSRSLSRRGQLDFLDHRLVPFLRWLGEEWRGGVLQIFHEHFVAARVEDFLASRWGPLSDAAAGPPIVVAALEHDEHVLGLHAGAWVLATQGHRVLFLGARTPVQSLLEVTRRHPVAALLTQAPASPGPRTARELFEELSAGVPEGVRCLLGGLWRGRPLPGWTDLESFRELSDQVFAGLVEGQKGSKPERPTWRS